MRKLKTTTKALWSDRIDWKFPLSMSVMFRLHNEQREWKQRTKGIYIFCHKTQTLTILETAESFTTHTTSKAIAWAYIRLLCNRDENFFNAFANWMPNKNKQAFQRNAKKNVIYKMVCLFRRLPYIWRKVVKRPKMNAYIVVEFSGHQNEEYSA